MSELATRLRGSSDLYEFSGRRPSASINFVTAHDGFTLRDLVSYEQKHNERNGEGNADGHNDNLAWNCGVEGPSEDRKVQKLRQRQQRNFLATLLFSQGVPMICGGDELGRTQQGNNNAYCQDNELSWHDWELDRPRVSLLNFTRRLIAFRRQHPNFRRHKFFQGRPIRGTGAKDITWLRPDGGEMSDEEWAAGWQRTLGVRFDGDAMEVLDEQGRRVTDDTFLLLLNAHHEPVPFTLPGSAAETHWGWVFDTNRPRLSAGAGSVQALQTVTLAARSLALFQLTR